ncbi:HAD family phosphatase [Calothrix sp. PCC 7507]|uniref:HAD family hydrolase n=1 Tax=Calothrix sp. PCC 7507 TaxID=99598 RepID=UPI00029EEE9C|nr:HAD family phosphatase [Calothrix sp. PCC 7507]AFY30730.1 HAD-superfamily hydrolase, subfamily IA, variant 3 [Calothrix sp. PCC 7507]
MDKFDLVIFDCDGVLVDSEHITNSVFAEMLNEMGLPVTLADMFDTFVGKSMAVCLEIIQQKLGKPVPDDFLSEYKQRTKKALVEKLQPIPGIHEVLAKLNLPFCVASNGVEEMMQTKLNITGLLPYFEGKLFSITHVARGKPHPDIFLYAAEKMGFAPQRCAVVEDTPTGVEAGFTAGMTVFGYAAISNPEQLRAAGASIVFNDMGVLPKLLQ